VIKVRNLERSLRFYTDILGMDVMGEIPELNIAFLANNRRDHHELGLLEVGPEAEGLRATGVGLLHVAFRLRSESELQAAYRELKEKGVPIAFTADHGVTKSVYLRDPDGHEVELYCDNPPEEYMKLPNPYAGSEKLTFAKDELGLADVFAQMDRERQVIATPQAAERRR
jgi:catechol 2,3-dioxygenase